MKDWSLKIPEDFDGAQELVQIASQSGLCAFLVSVRKQVDLRLLFCGSGGSLEYILRSRYLTTQLIADTTAAVMNMLEHKSE